MTVTSDTHTVVIPTSELVVTAYVWESGTRRQQFGDEMAWVQLCADFDNVQVPFMCLLQITRLDPPVERAARRVKLSIEGDHFIVNEVFMAQYGSNGSPWAVCTPL